MNKIIIAVLLLITVVCSSVCSMEYEYGISPQFQYAGKFIGNSAIVSIEGKTKVSDKYGNITEYESPGIKQRSNGLIMVVGDNGFAAFFDSFGNRLTDYIYDSFPLIDSKTGDKTYRFGYYDGDGKSELVPFSKDKKYGYINSKGVEVIPARYEYAYGFVNGMALICANGVLSEYGTYTNGKYGYILENGEEILPPDSYWIADNNPEYGYIIFANGEDGKVLADLKGNVVKADEHGYAAIDANYIKITSKDGRMGVKDNKGNIVIPMDSYTLIEYNGNNLFVLNNKKVVNDKFETIYEAGENEKVYVHYINIYERSKFLRVVRDGNKYGLISPEGKVIVPSEYNTLYDLSEGVIYGSKDGGNFLLNYKGDIICTINANNCGECTDGIIPALDFSSGKYGYVLNPIIYPKVYVNDEKIVSDVYPKIENNRTLIPMRAVFEALQAEVSWDDITRTVTASKNGVQISLKTGSNILYKNGNPIEIDVPSKIENNRTLVPLRAVSESLECLVEWDEEMRTVYINFK